jgi:hypothetical protein
MASGCIPIDEPVSAGLVDESARKFVPLVWLESVYPIQQRGGSIGVDFLGLKFWSQFKNQTKVDVHRLICRINALGSHALGERCLHRERLVFVLQQRVAHFMGYNKEI